MSLLIIYPDLNIGGVQTLYLRLAKERFRQSQITRFLLTRVSRDQGLLDEISPYADVKYLYELYTISKIVSKRFFLSLPISKNRVMANYSDITHIHVADGYCALLGYKLSKILDNCKLTVGFYHPMEFCWGENSSLPYYEREIRKFLFFRLPKPNLFLYSLTIVDFYKKKIGVDLSFSSQLKLGVVEDYSNFRSCNVFSSHKKSKSFLICTIGRLVDFKLYIVWMIDVVESLLDDGYDIYYDIYGEGPLYTEIVNKIILKKLSERISLKGALRYQDFNSTVICYDLFVGGGTSIIQTSFLGIPSIIGIDSLGSSLTYGFFNEFTTIDYTLNVDSIRLISVKDLVEKYFKMSKQERDLLSIEHKKAAGEFSISKMNHDFEKKGIKAIMTFKKCFFLIELSLKWNYFISLYSSRGKVRSYLIE